MLRQAVLSVVLFAVLGPAVPAGETVGVEGSAARFPTRIEVKINSKELPLVLTGTALRKKYFLRVYAIASYLQEGTEVRNADDLAQLSAVKQLHLIFERGVDGETMAASFTEAIRMNYPAPAFAPELARLAAFFRSRSVRPGDQVRLTTLPGIGLSCQLIGRGDLIIRNPAFSQAAWEAYLGPNNLGLAIKSGLSSRLTR